MKTQFFLFFTTILIWYCIGVLWLSKIYLFQNREIQPDKNAGFFYGKMTPRLIWFFFIPIIVALICPIILIFFHSDAMPMGTLYSVASMGFYIIYIGLKIILPIIKPVNHRQNITGVSNDFKKNHLKVNLLFTLLGIGVAYLLWKSLSASF